MADITSVIEKIQKLRQLAKSDNLNEATAAAKKADALVLEYQLSEAELEVKGEAAEPILLDAENSVLYSTGRIVPWKLQLALNLSQHFGVYTYNDKGHRSNTYKMVGRLSDIRICQYFFDYLVSEIDRLATANVFQWKRGVSIERLNYCRGAVDAIVESFKAAKSELQKTTTSQAMVLVDNRLAAASECAHQKISGLKTQTIQSKAHVNYDSYAHGKKDGGTILLNKGLGGGSETKKTWRVMMRILLIMLGLVLTGCPRTFSGPVMETPPDQCQPLCDGAHVVGHMMVDVKTGKAGCVCGDEEPWSYR